MSARWWAPATGKVELDAVDKAMLAITGEDKRLDLGGVLLAAHRVGAGACRQAAGQPLLDERGLVGFLATARLNLGEPMYEAVAKCVDGQVEARLLTRDFLDDADAAAVGIFKAAVGKGVAPAVAAQRAGDIYGVDERSIGRYRQLAMDPKTSPAVLADHADRELFAYVELVVKEESFEEVSKATATAPTLERPDVSDERTYIRDANGQFARVGGQGAMARMRTRLGIGGQTAPKVSDVRPSEMEQATAQTAREALAARQVRAQRAKARRAQRAKTATQPAVETAPATAPTRTAPARRQQLARAASQRAQLSRAATRPAAVTAALQPEAAAKPAGEIIPTAESMTQGFASDVGQPFDTIADQVSLVLPGTAGQRFIVLANNLPGGIFRLGHLTSRAQPAVLGDDNAAMQDALGNAGFTHPDYETKFVSAADLDRAYPQLAGDRVKQRAAATFEWLVSRGLDPQDPEILERQRFEVADTTSDKEPGWYLVDDNGTPHWEQPLTYDFVIPAGEVKGINLGDEAHPKIALDRNQFFRVRKVGGINAVNQFSWNKQGFMRARIELEPVDVEEFKDAQRERYLETHNDEAQPRWPIPPELGGEATDLGKADTAVLERTEEARDTRGRWVRVGTGTATGAMARMRERLAADADTASVQREQAVAARAVRTRRSAQSKRKKLTAVPAQLVTQDALQRNPTQQRVTRPMRAISQRRLRDPQRIAAQRQALAAVAQAQPEQKFNFRPEHVHTRASLPLTPVTELPPKRELDASFTDDHAVLPSDDFEELLLEAPGADVIGMSPGTYADLYDSRMHPERIRNRIRDDHQYAAQEAVYTDETRSFATDSQVLERVNELLRQPDISTVTARSLRALGPDGEDQPDMWNLRYNKNPTSPIVLVRFPDEENAAGGAMELHKMSGTQHLMRTVGDVSTGAYSAYAIPVITYEAQTPHYKAGQFDDPFIDPFDE